MELYNRLLVYGVLEYGICFISWQRMKRADNESLRGCTGKAALSWRNDTLKMLGKVRNKYRPGDPQTVAKK